MATTIQTIAKPTRARALDTSGNNNHAQIYSGRALEFDGVTDYLNVNGGSVLSLVDVSAEATVANRAWTIAFWFNFDAAGSATQYFLGRNDSGGATSVPMWIALNGSEKLTIYDLSGSAWRVADTVLNPGTWYRAVYVFNGVDTINFYVNGVADGSGAITNATDSDNADLALEMIGAKIDSGVITSPFAGKMSDLQAWQGAWTQDDVTYDYLNPEQLALNNSGTSLTNSNLKLWYPMNDGHRGNQSYVLDASNTGGTKNNATTVFYGDDLFDAGVGDYGDSTGAWVAQGGNGMTNDTSALKITYADNDDGAKLMLNNAADLNSDLTVGRSYRLTYTYKINTDDGTTMNAQINKGDSTFETSNLTETSFTTLTKDFVAAHATNAAFRFNNMDSGDILWIKDISLKEIGTATGWTDADQQLDIPQTALQSYNHLAWFDGAADHVSIADHNDFSFGDGSSDSAFSVSAWVFMNNIDDGYPIINKYGSTSTREWGFRVSFADQKLNFFTFDESTDAYIGRKYNTSMASYVGKWVHLVGTKDDTEASSGFALYINGEKLDDADFASGSYTATEQLGSVVSIGNDGANTKWANGSTTEACIWNKELSQTEVTELYNSGLALDATTHSASSNLIGYWRNNGVATWQDLTANNRDGTPTSVTETMLITAGVDSSRDSQGFLMNRQRTTNSLNFANDSGMPDGTFDYARIEASGDDDLAFIGVGDAFSLSCWIKVHHLASTAQVFLSRNDNTDGWRFMVNSANKLQFNIEENGNLANAVTDSALSEGTWYHTVGTFDGDPSNNGSGALTLYLNGVTGGDTTNGDTSADMDAVSAVDGVTIGRHNSSLENEGFFGEVDDVCIYDKVLSQAEITRNYNAGKRSHR